jgi:hypothetical protein
MYLNVEVPPYLNERREESIANTTFLAGDDDTVLFRNRVTDLFVQLDR